MAGQQTMSGLIVDLTGQTLVLPVILTGQFWIQTCYFPYSCRLMFYNAVMISFFFGFFAALKNAAINFMWSCRTEKQQSKTGTN